MKEKREPVAIEVNDKYRISVDAQNWTVLYKSIVKKKGSKNLGKEQETAIAFCYNLKLSVQAIVRDMVARGDFPEEVSKLENMLEWYAGKESAIANIILSRKEELKEALEYNKVI